MNAIDQRNSPSAFEEEQSLLGALLVDEEAVEQAATMPVEWLERAGHQRIFSAIKTLHEQGKPVDIVTVSTELRSKGLLEELGGAAYLAALIEICPNSANVGAYIEAIRWCATLRDTIAAGRAITDLAFEAARNGTINRKPVNATEGLEVLKAAVDSLLEKPGSFTTEPGYRHVSSVMAGVMADFAIRLDSDDAMVGIPTGFIDLDRKWRGLRKGHLIVIGARPGMGKSAFALQMAFQVSLQGHPVLIFCLEMPAEEMVQRLACNLSRVDFDAFEIGKVTDDQLSRVMDAVDLVKRLPFFIEDKPGMTVKEMRVRARRLEKEVGRRLGLIVVDYLQLAADETNSNNRATAVGNIAEQCLTMAKERQTSVAAISSLSRACEQREDKRPILSDLRESGAVEFHANRALFIYRDGYYRKMGPAPTPRSKSNDWQHTRDGSAEEDPNTDDGDDNIAEVILAKNRGGPLGTVRLVWTGKHVRFDNLEEHRFYQGGPYP